MTPQLSLVAHQGGWDEILMVAGPLAVFGGVLWLANKRANQRLADAAADDDEPTGPDAVPAASDSSEISTDD